MNKQVEAEMILNDVVKHILHVYQDDMEHVRMKLVKQTTRTGDFSSKRYGYILKIELTKTGDSGLYAAQTMVFGNKQVINELVRMLDDVLLHGAETPVFDLGDIATTINNRYDLALTRVHPPTMLACAELLSEMLHLKQSDSGFACALDMNCVEDEGDFNVTLNGSIHTRTGLSIGLDTQLICDAYKHSSPDLPSFTLPLEIIKKEE